MFIEVSEDHKIVIWTPINTKPNQMRVHFLFLMPIQPAYPIVLLPSTTFQTVNYLDTDTPSGF